MQPKRNIGYFTVILGNSNVPGVGRETETLQQVLGHPHLEPRTDNRAIRLRTVPGGQVGVIKTHQQVGSRLEPLQVTKIARAGILIHHRVREDIERLRIRPVHLQGTGKYRVETGDVRTATQS